MPTKTPVQLAWEQLLLAQQGVKDAEYAGEVQGIEAARRQLAAAQAEHTGAVAAEKPAPKPAPPAPKPAPSKVEAGLPPAKAKPKPVPVKTPAPKGSGSSAPAVEPVTRDLKPPRKSAAERYEEKAEKARAAADEKRKARATDAKAEAKPPLQPGTYWNGFHYVKPTDSSWNRQDYEKFAAKKPREEKPAETTDDAPKPTRKRRKSTSSKKSSTKSTRSKKSKKND
jgi:hypothetical protein